MGLLLSIRIEPNSTCSHFISSCLTGSDRCSATGILSFNATGALINALQTCQTLTYVLISLQAWQHLPGLAFLHGQKHCPALERPCADAPAAPVPLQRCCPGRADAPAALLLACRVHISLMRHCTVQSITVLFKCDSAPPQHAEGHGALLRSVGLHMADCGQSGPFPIYLFCIYLCLC